MRIVTDGKYYAIEKGWFFKKYMSLNYSNIWYNIEESHPYCWGDKEKVKQQFYLINHKNKIRPLSKKELEDENN